MIKDNITDGYKTTILGVFLIALGIAYFATPYINDSFTYEINKWYEVALVVSGVGFIVAPDKMVNIMFGWLQKFLPNQKK